MSRSRYGENRDAYLYMIVGLTVALALIATVHPKTIPLMQALPWPGIVCPCMVV